MGFYYLSSNSNLSHSKFLKRKSQIDELANAFSHFNSKTQKRSPAGMIPETLANETYQNFLVKNNKYHLLLSYKIEHERKSVTNDDAYFSYEDQQLREFEKNHQLRYAAEIEKLLKSGNFENHEKEEFFLIEEYALFEPEEVVNIIESKVMKSIMDFKANEEKNVEYFKKITSLYIQKISEHEIDKNERRKLLEMAITSPKLSLILKSIWN